MVIVSRFQQRAAAVPPCMLGPLSATILLLVESGTTLPVPDTRLPEIWKVCPVVVETVVTVLPDTVVLRNIIDLKISNEISKERGGGGGTHTIKR